jgi:hypothetical protein
MLRTKKRAKGGHSQGRQLDARYAKRATNGRGSRLRKSAELLGQPDFVRSEENAAYGSFPPVPGSIVGEAGSWADDGEE